MPSCNKEHVRTASPSQASTAEELLKALEKTQIRSRYLQANYAYPSLFSQLEACVVLACWCHVRKDDNVAAADGDDGGDELLPFSPARPWTHLLPEA